MWYPRSRSGSGVFFTSGFSPNHCAVRLIIRPNQNPQLDLFACVFVKQLPAISWHHKFVDLRQHLDLPHATDKFQSG